MATKWECAHYDRDQWRMRIAQGRVTRNGRIATITDEIDPGDRISYDAGDFDEPDADLDYRIINEDPWLLGIDKPGNLLVHRAGKSFRNNLIYQLRYVHEPPFPAAQTIHRLDRDTSGVVLAAKNGGSRTYLFRSVFRRKNPERI